MNDREKIEKRKAELEIILKELDDDLNTLRKILKKHESLWKKYKRYVMLKSLMNAMIWKKA